jgi:hypothetical protein
MAEIKSTLDLVMARTRHLTLSEKEKAQNRREELHRKIQGLVQKRMDQRLTLVQFQRERTQLQGGHPEAGDGLFIEIIQANLDLEQDPRILLELLQGEFGIDTAPIAAVFASHDKEVAQARKERTAQLEEDWRVNHGLHGSALVPRLESDPQWIASFQALCDENAKRLEQVCASA